MPGDDRPASSVADSFGFDQPREEWLTRLKRAAAPADLGRLGDYELLEEVGRGAQGVVFKAVQPHTRRVVALKRLAAGSLATTPTRARFEREVEAACLLDHPGIVTVHGVEMLDGQPVLAMEWVEGLPIDRWAAGPPEHARRDVLAVFAQACDAVAHAHRRGVLHRDIKPSNVLVDVQGRARVLDFGLAKLLPGASAWAETSLTRPGGFVGTPAYAPPEVLDDPDSVDTRSDVYALGIILYRLLAGALPFEPTKGVAGMLDQVRRGVSRPPSVHRPGIGPELDAITLKAVAAEPDRRYASADDLAADVRRYLAGEAVEAHPPGRAYLARKFVRRHRAAVSIVAGGFLVTAVLAAVATSFAVRLARQQERLRDALGTATDARAEEARARADAEASAGEARASLARAMRQTLRYQAATRVLEGILSGSLDLGSDEPDGAARQLGPGPQASARDPVQAARIRRELARMLIELGLYQEALEQSEEALRLAVVAEGPGGRPAIQSLATRAQCLSLLGRLADAERELRQVVQLRESIGREGGPAIGAARSDLGDVLMGQGRPVEAEAQFRAALEARPETARRPILARYEIERDLAAALLDQGRVEEADTRAREALALVRSRGDTDTAVIAARRVMARIHLAAGRIAEAEADQRGVVTRWTAALGPDHPIPARETVRLAVILAARGHTAQAEPMVRDAIATLTAGLPAHHPWIASAKLELARLPERGDARDSTSLARAAFDEAAGTPPGCEKLIAETAVCLARVLRARGAEAEAARVVDEARTLLAARLAPEHPLAAICAGVLNGAESPVPPPGD